MSTLFKQENVISLRTAGVCDDGNTASLSLFPADLIRVASKNLDWVHKDFIWLYRHLRLPAEERKLRDVYPPILEQDLRPMEFSGSPNFRLIWTDSGNGLALCINEEPWAFIDEVTHFGYSKGVLKSGVNDNTMNMWNEELFVREYGSQI